jgi:hypothetical protein
MKHCVTSARSFVHLLGCHLTILHSSIYNVDGLFHSVYGHFDKVLHEYFSIVFFSDLQVLPFMRIQEVLNLVLIDLVKTQMNFPLKQRSSLFLFLEYFKNAINRLRDNSLAVHINIVEHSHGVCLTCSCLPIDKVRPIVPIQDVVHQRQTGSPEDLFLVNAVIKDLIELVLPWSFFGNHQLNQLRILLCSECALPLHISILAALASSWVEDDVLHLVLKRRPNADEDLDVFFRKTVGLASLFLILERRVLIFIDEVLVRAGSLHAHRWGWKCLRDYHAA